MLLLLWKRCRSTSRSQTGADSNESAGKQFPAAACTALPMQEVTSRPLVSSPRAAQSAAKGTCGFGQAAVLYRSPSSAR